MSIYGNVIGAVKPVLDVEVQKDSENAVQSGAVYDHVETMHNELVESISAIATTHSTDKEAIEEQLDAKANAEHEHSDLSSEISALNTLVGDEAVASQISKAVENVAIKWVNF